MGHLGELSVDVPRENLLIKLRDNRARHRDQYIKALEGYKLALVDELDKKIADVKEGKEVGRYDTNVRPEDHTEDYDEVIEMYTMSEQDTVTLSQSDFRQFVRDDWGWKQSWTVSNSAYIQAASAR